MKEGKIVFGKSGNYFLLYYVLILIDVYKSYNEDVPQLWSKHNGSIASWYYNQSKSISKYFKIEQIYSTGDRKNVCIPFSLNFLMMSAI